MRRSGKCQKCPYRWTMKKDGTLGKHLLYTGHYERKPCDGSGLPPRDGSIKATK